MRESVPRKVDKKSGVPEEEKQVWGSQGGDRGLEFSRRRKGQTPFFPSTFLSLGHMRLFFFFLPLSLQCRDPGSIPVLGRSPGEGNGNPL